MECVEFKSDEQRILRGIVHNGNPEKRKHTTIICLNTGLNDMVGWHRIQVKNAHFLAEQGFDVLRFDTAGIGDSEGELDEGNVLDIFVRIEEGLWASSAICAFNFMKSKYNNPKTYYLGYCGGGLTAFHAAAKERRISGIINIAAPVTLSNIRKNNKDHFTISNNVSTLKSKMLNIKSLTNFFTGKSSYKEIAVSVYYYLFYKVINFKKKRSNDVKIAAQPTIDNLNYEFFKSFEAFRRTNRKTLFIYGNLDKATWGLKNYLFKKYSDDSLLKCEKFEFHELDNANHIFSDEQSQDDMKKIILSWLTQGEK
jgi:pimeloyl-ACP methyl ester carboxylesterase